MNRRGWQLQFAIAILNFNCTPPIAATSTTYAEPTDSNLRVEYHRLEEVHRQKIARDRQDVNAYMQRELELSRNKLWSNVEGPECDGILRWHPWRIYTKYGSVATWTTSRRSLHLSTIV